MNETNKNLFNKKEYIESNLNKAFIDVKYLSYVINEINSKKSNSHNVISDRYSISSTVYKRIWIYFNKIKYITDNGHFSLLIKKKFSSI